MNNSTIYGHRQLSLFFIPLLEVYDDGFNFKGKSYTWADIVDISVRKPPIAFHGCLNLGMPGANVYLRDGRIIKLAGRTLEKKGIKPIVDFISSQSNAFNELTDLFKSKIT